MNKHPLMQALMLFALALGYVISSSAINHQTPSFEIPSPPPLRIAVVGFTGTPSRSLEIALTESLAKNERVVLLDAGQIKPALAAFGYDGAINMSIEDAKHLGATLGCDFFIIGKSDSATRSESAGEAHEETFIGVMLVDGRSGALVVFDFLVQKATKREDAERLAAQTLSQQTKSY